MEEILHQAEQLEKNYDWLGAVESYRKALDMLSVDDFSRKGDITERLGYAFFRFAFQAESLDEFRSRLCQSSEAYEKALDFYGRLSELAKTARAQRCNGMIAYIGYWLSPEAPEKKRLLQEGWRFTEDSLRASKESGEAKEYGVTYNQLATTAFLGFCLEWNYQTRKEIIKEVAEYGEAGIKLLSSIDAPDELAKTYAKTAFAYSLFAYYFLDLDEKENCVRKAQNYWSKAKEGSEDSARLEMMCPVPCAHDLLLGVGSQEALANVQKALEHGKRTRDKFIIGSALDWLAYNTWWAYSQSTGDCDEVVKIAKTIIQYAEDAKRQYSVISFISPRADTAWIEGIHAQVTPEYDFETDLRKRHSMLQREIAAGKEAFKSAEASGYPSATIYVHNILSKNLPLLAEIESGLEEKKKLLEEALQHGNETLRIGEYLEPLSYWDMGNFMGDLAEIKCRLANLAGDPETKKSMLQTALLEREKATQLMLKDPLLKELSYQPQKNVPLFTFLGRVEYFAGNWWTSLYRLTNDKEHLRKATEAFRNAVESFKKPNLLSRIAECYWKAAQTCDSLGDHLKAAQNFHLASDNYKSAAEKIPQLKDFYLDHAGYMQAWAEIEEARHHHERQEYGLAKEHFQKAADLHKSLKKWSYLASNYCAWANIEGAEDFSRKEQCEEAIQAFEEALKLFDETKKSTQNELGKIEDADEKRMANSMVKATDMRQEYCVARIAIEDAKILDKKGDHYASSEKYGSAAETFEKLSHELESEQEQREFKFIASLSRAWQKMTRAEAEASPTLYFEASQLFEEAKEFGQSERIKMLELGHSRFCKALEAGTRFIDTRDATLHDAIIQHLGSAADYYVKAGFQKVSEYAKATKLLFDAYVHIGNAERETDPEKKAKFYAMAEKILQISAGSFTKAEHPEKRQQVLRLLEKAREERKLAAYLTDVLHAPSIVSTTRVFRPPTPTHEEAVGSEKFEHADIQANLIIHQKELKVGESLSLEMELVNAGKGPALLIKVNEAIPEGFEVIEKPETYHIEDSYINMKGKRLDPLKAEELRLVLKPKVQGTFHFKPTILYLDENGKYKSHEPEPLIVTVKRACETDREVSQPKPTDYVSTGYVDLDKLLYGGIPSNCAVALTSPSCDERTLLIKSFLEAGAKKGEVAFYITMDLGVVKPLAEEFQSSFYVFICNPQADAIIRDLPNVFKLKGIENLTELGITLTSAIHRFDSSQKAPRRICIDLISDVLLQHHTVQTRRWLIALIPELKSAGFATLAVMDPQIYPPEELHAILGLFDGEVNIYEKGTEQFLKIKRMSNQKYIANEIALTKTSEVS